MTSIMLIILIGSLTTTNWIAIGSILTVIGLAFLGMLGKLIYNQGKLETGVGNLDKRFDKLDEKIDKFILLPLANSRSPVTLTDLGLNIFNRPKIEDFTKNNLNEIIEKMKASSLTSAYEAQEKLFEIVDVYKLGKYKVDLENEAFEAGQHIDILMKVIAIGIRDKVFAELELKVADIDQTPPSESK